MTAIQAVSTILTVGLAGLAAIASFIAGKRISVKVASDGFDFLKTTASTFLLMYAIGFVAMLRYLWLPVELDRQLAMPLPFGEEIVVCAVLGYAAHIAIVYLTRRRMSKSNN